MSPATEPTPNRYGVVLRLGRLGGRTLYHLLRRIPEDVPVTVLRVEGHQLALEEPRCRIVGGDAISAGSLAAIAADMDVPALLLCGDDGLIALPETPPANAGIIRLLPVEGPLYGPARSHRPEHFLGPAFVPVGDLDALIGGEPVALDRWIGHRVALHARRHSVTLAGIAPGTLVLPSLAQASGADQHRGRIYARVLLADAGDAQADAFLSLDDPAADPMVAADAKARIDAALSVLTHRLAADIALVERQTPAAPLAKDGSIGVLKLDSIGDAVLGSSFLRAIRQHFTGAIRLVAGSHAEPLVELDPHADRRLLLPIGAPLFDPAESPVWLEAHIDEVAGFLRGLDATAIPRLAPDYYLANQMAMLAGVPRRFGLSGEAAGDVARFNAGFTFMMTDVVTVDNACHEVEAMAMLAEAMGCAPMAIAGYLHLAEADRAPARTIRAAHPAGRLVALGLAASSGRRRWPAERLIAVARALASDGVAGFILVGGKDVADTARAIVLALGDLAIDRVGQLSLRETAAAIGVADLFIGNDSSAMHLAAAMGVPVVEISCHPMTSPDTHENSPLRFGPLAVPRRILRPPLPRDEGCAAGCVSRHDPHCILGVEAEAAIDAARGLIN